MWAFIPKYYWLPFFVWCISGSRSPVLFFVELGAAISVASTTVPVFSSRPLPLQQVVDGGQDLIGQLVLLQPVPKAQARRLVRQAPTQRQTREVPEQRHIVQRLFHRRITQREPLARSLRAQAQSKVSLLLTVDRPSASLSRQARLPGVLQTILSHYI
jgi:hypothetical protein